MKTRIPHQSNDSDKKVTFCLLVWLMNHFFLFMDKLKIQLQKQTFTIFVSFSSLYPIINNSFVTIEEEIYPQNCANKREIYFFFRYLLIVCCLENPCFHFNMIGQEKVQLSNDY